MSAGEDWCLDRIKDGTLKLEEGAILLYHRTNKRWITKTVCYRSDTGGGRGYMKFGDRRLKVYLHRLLVIFETLSSLPENGVVDHKDGNKLNNIQSNLDVTSKMESDSQGGNKIMDLKAEQIGRWFEFVGKHGREPIYNEEILFVETGF